MNKSNMFKNAHAKARATVKFVGDYAIAFSCALKSGYQLLVAIKEAKEKDARKQGQKVLAAKWAEKQEASAVAVKKAVVEFKKPVKKMKTFWQAYNCEDESGMSGMNERANELRNA